MPAEPRSLRDPAALAARLATIDANEPHIAPLNDFVRRLRLRRGDGEGVPWFDPASAGVKAELLFLLEAPGARSVSQPGLRTSQGSGIISPDNDDATAANLTLLRDAAGLDRNRVLHWNVVPWYIGTTAAIRPATTEDIAEGLPELRQVLKLLPRLRVVMTMGRAAQIGWAMYAQRYSSAVVTIPSTHPSPRALNSRPTARPATLAALRAAAAVLNSYDAAAS